MKKKFFLAVSILVACVLFTVAHATTYYVDPQGSDANSGTSVSSPWQTLDKVNDTGFKPGDRILFKKGGTWTGTLTPSVPGSALHPITYSSYGTGAKPIITGLAQLSQWKSVGNGIYEVACISCGDTVNTVTVNNVDIPMGRFPNEGYLTIESHTASSISDSHLAGTPNWAGAEAVIRKERWILDRNPITGDNGTTLNITQGSEYPSQDGWGYFIQNSLATLDRQGEWYYNPATHIFYMYFGSNNPSGYVVQVSTVDTLIKLQQNFVTIDGFNLIGANNRAIGIDNMHNAVIQNNDSSFSGKDGLTLDTASYVSIANNTFTDSHDIAVSLVYDAKHVTVKNNIIKSSGLIAGIGSYYSAISIENPATYITVDHNTVTNTGYTAISFQGNHVRITNNVIDTFTTLLDDGAGIYTWNDFHPSLVHTDRVVTGNTITNGIAAPAGTPDATYLPSEGVYMDESTDHVSISRNTISHVADSGIYLHIPDPKGSIVVKNNNTILNAAKKVWIEKQ